MFHKALVCFKGNCLFNIGLEYLLTYLSIFMNPQEYTEQVYYFRASVIKDVGYSDENMSIPFRVPYSARLWLAFIITIQVLRLTLHTCYILFYYVVDIA